MNLDGKTAIVTGGASGIGKAIAKRFLKNGADEVVIGDISEDLEKTAKEIGADYKKCDVSDREQVKELVEYTVNEHGKLDIMVNNAGIGALHGIEEMDEDEYRKVRSINLDGVVYGCKEATPYLKQTKGNIINIASIYGLVGDVGATAYQTAKGGVVNLTRAVADDLAEHPVRVNSIAPGYVDTPMTEEIQEDEEFMQHIMNETPMKRLAQPEEIASVAAFLASEEASYITGANIPVDGGWTSH